MGFIINNKSLINELDLWKVNMDPLPDINYKKLIYKETNKNLYVCLNKKIIEEINILFDRSIIDKKISESYDLFIQIHKNKPGFKLIPHFDNDTILGIIIINLIDNKTSTEFYNTDEIKIGQAPLNKGDGVMYLNNYDFKHGYSNTSLTNRYICFCTIKKQ